MQAQGQPQKNEYTYKDYLTWPDGEHWEIIDGKAYPTYGPTALAAPVEAHQDLVGELFRLIANYLRGKPCKVFISPFDVVFEESEYTKTVVQPDILVVCDPKKLENGKRVIGAPDIAVEVLSPSTSSKDWFRKLRLYESRGVKEYWIVSADERAIYKNILTDGQYQMETLKKGELTSRVLEGFSLDISEFFSILDTSSQEEAATDSKAGELQARLEIAKNALQESASIEFVQKITGLDRATVEQLGAALPGLD